MLSKTLLTLALGLPTIHAHCTLSLLQSVTTQYLAAQSSGRGTSLNISASGVYTENFQPTPIASSILATPLKIDHSFSIYDTSQCASFTEIIVTDPSHPYVLGTQIRLDQHGATEEIQKIETLVTDEGDWLFNATNALLWTKRENWDPIPVAERDSRATLQAAANAYLDKFNDNSVSVPFNLPCARLEGGIYTGQGLETDSCDLGFPTGIPMLNRRFVIDPTYGTVEVMFNFGGPTSSPDSHLFRLLKGKIRYAHTMTVLKCNALPEDPCNS